MKILAIVAGCILGLLFFLLMLEGISVTPHYVAEPAVVLRTGPDTCGWIGADEETVVRFNDGLTITVARWLGNAGDHVLVGRQRGTRTLFHILERGEE